MPSPNEAIVITLDPDDRTFTPKECARFENDPCPPWPSSNQIAHDGTYALAGGVLSLEGWSRRPPVFLAGCLV